MGKRSTIESTVGILSAFLRRRTWNQAELARALNLESRALRRHLNELTLQGFPLERDEEPPQVYWSMPKDWFPGGVLLEAEEAQLLIRLLCRVPGSKQRNALLRRMSSALPAKGGSIAQLESVFHGVGDEAPFVALVTEAAAQRATIHFQYFSAKRGALEWRHASVQRVLPGPPARMVARCHRSGNLKWFRIDGILDGRLEPEVPYQEAMASEVDQYLASSLDGFAAEAAPAEHCFFVAEPDARWVRKNLISPMKAESIPGGVRVTCETTATLRLARFVLGLAPIARAQSPELASLVQQLAAATLELHPRAKPPRAARRQAEGTKALAPPARTAGGRRRS
jgi:predicted DNA-binding transcriptional regulator YafY